ncbi:hypothetical protein FN846DRAFT_1019608 [Sphaerosporella brunnea]|uniref:Transcription initiation factor IIA subunit 2 n=1 Tax=Sphaerosporella brunnea TaxID=1250544 RepID=A0A5J5F4Y3_9PEZI|nr:hypothetical protein FN846DRAFT_1019608 [Sphaerosporella brunnea]
MADGNPKPSTGENEEFVARQLKKEQLYHCTSIGTTFIDTVDDMVAAGKITNEVAYKMLQHFNRAMADAMENKLKGTVNVKVDTMSTTLPSVFNVLTDNFQGKINRFNCLGDTWSFQLKDVTATVESTAKGWKQTVKADKLLMVTVPTEKGAKKPRGADAKTGKVGRPRKHKR